MGTAETLMSRRAKLAFVTTRAKLLDTLMRLPKLEDGLIIDDLALQVFIVEMGAA